MTKLDRATFATALLALILASCCIYQIHALRADLQALHTAPPPDTATLERRLSRLEAVTPDVGQTMLSIHLHFSKMYFAAEARNWDLARFEREEILEDLNTVAMLKPEERGVSLTGIIGAFTNSAGSPMAALKDAMDVSDRPLFRKAYKESIVMCNACHAATGRPVVITEPTNPPVFNQRWEPTSSVQK